ncbi:MAG: ROK family protein [Acidobacteriota bacterium]|nr:MAG: ROK family protein [Acidobacteriota bacterium]
MMRVGGIEGGGTKFVCAIGTGPDDIEAEVRFPTTTPEETLRNAIEFFSSQERPVDRIGIASFGPLDLNPESPRFGFISQTPKVGWPNTDVRGTISRALDVPVWIDTDTNAPALAEHKWGALQGLDTCLYITVGTGIGGGGLVGGKLMHGLVHPEMGHMRIPHDKAVDPFEGACPFHKDCWEGLAAGPAIEARWKCRGENLPDEHPAWALEARYLAFALQNLILTLSPQRIVVGGGVMDRAHLFPMVRQEVVSLLNAYVRSPAILEGIDTLIVPPALGNRAGVLGGIALAQAELVGPVGLV